MEFARTAEQTPQTELRSNSDYAETLVLACGALAREILDVCQLNDLDHLTLECLPAKLHMEPAKIPGELRRRLDAAIDNYDRVLIGYADCGTAGEVDTIVGEYADRIEIGRLPGAHCYQFFATSDRFDRLHDGDPTVFYLTDFLAKYFDLMVMDSLGITKHPELLPMYFGNYTRVTYLAQTDDPALDEAAAQAAAKLGLKYDRIVTGYGELTESLVTFGTASREATEVTEVAEVAEVTA